MANAVCGHQVTQTDASQHPGLTSLLTIKAGSTKLTQTEVSPQPARCRSLAAITQPPSPSYRHHPVWRAVRWSNGHLSGSVSGAVGFFVALFVFVASDAYLPALVPLRVFSGFLSPPCQQHVRGPTRQSRAAVGSNPRNVATARGWSGCAVLLLPSLGLGRL